MNALVDVRFTVDVSEEKLEALVGRPDDNSDAWFRQACEAAERAVEDDPMPFLESAGPPDVRCDG